MAKLYKTSTLLVTASLLSALYSYSGTADALDLEGAKEQPCFQINKTIEVDPTWMANAPKIWYYPLMSRLELYYNSLELAGKDARDLPENEVYYDSCIQYEDFDLIGFGGRRAAVKITPSNSTDAVKSCRFELPSGKGGWAYPTLTDNSTFMFTASCMDDDQMVWGAISPFKTLPAESVKMIHEHAEALGFNKKFFTGIRYDYCKDS